MPTLALLLALPMVADDAYFPEPASDAVLREVVEFRTHGHAGRTFNHAFVAPAKVEAGKTYPLIVFLHGAGERGDDPAVLLKHFFPAVCTPEFRERFPCYVLAPQCPKDERWSNVSWSEETPDGLPGDFSEPLAAARALLGESMTSLPVDPHRVYLTGISMGGYGTWDWIAREPDRFAAAAPVCGGGDPATAEKFAALPLWVAHGDDDRAVPVGRSRSMVAAVRAAGGEPIYVEYPGVGHDVWTAAYSNPDGLLAWMFRQSK